MAVESIPWPNLHERMFRRTQGSNPRPSAQQAEAHPTELAGPAEKRYLFTNCILIISPYRGNVHQWNGTSLQRGSVLPDELLLYWIQIQINLTHFNAISVDGIKNCVVITCGIINIKRVHNLILHNMVPLYGAPEGAYVVERTSRITKNNEMYKTVVGSEVVLYVWLCGFPQRSVFVMSCWYLVLCDLSHLE